MRPGSTRRGLWLALLAVAALVAAGVVAAVLLTRGGDERTTTTRTVSSTGTSVVVSTGVSAQISSSAVSSAEQGTAVVPSVVGLSSERAAARIKGLGLQSLARSERSPKPNGVVVGQNPGPGTRLPHDGLVGLVVSAGPQGNVVPLLVGQPVAEALAKLRAAGFSARTRKIVSARRAGTVVGQSPTAGAPAAGPVVLSVSTGSPRATVPDVIGRSEKDARTLLGNAGIPSAVVRVHSKQAVGRVVAQSPGAGASIERGARVTLSVSSGIGP